MYAIYPIAFLVFWGVLYEASVNAPVAAVYVKKLSPFSLSPNFPMSISTIWGSTILFTDSAGLSESPKFCAKSFVVPAGIYPNKGRLSFGMRCIPQTTSCRVPSPPQHTMYSKFVPSSRAIDIACPGDCVILIFTSKSAAHSVLQIVYKLSFPFITPAWGFIISKSVFVIFNLLL